MYITKFGEVLKLFTIDDFSYGNHKLLTNVYDNSDITENIFNSTLYNYKKANVLDLVDNTTVCTTKNLDYIQIALNTVKSSSTNKDKKLFFKCNFTLRDAIENQYIAVIGEYNYVSWVLIEINNNKLEFYDNESADITTNTLVKSIDIPEGWVEFEIDSHFDEDSGFFRHTIKINNDLVVENISGNKKSAENYNSLCYDDGLVLYNIHHKYKSYLIYKDISIQRQYDLFIKKPEVKIQLYKNDEYIILNPLINIDPTLQANNETSRYTFVWDDGSTMPTRVVDYFDEEYKVFSCTITDSLSQVTNARILVENFKEYTNNIVKYCWLTTGEVNKTITFKSDAEFISLRYVVQDIYGELYYGSCAINNIKAMLVNNDETASEEPSEEPSEGNPSENPSEEPVTDPVSDEPSDEPSEPSTSEPKIIEYHENDGEFVEGVQINEDEHIDYKIVSILWNTGETTKSIDIDVNENEYNVYTCKITDSLGKVTTDSIVVDKFVEPYNDVSRIIWDGSYTNDSYIVDTTDECSIHTCAAFDLFDNSSVAYFTVENFKKYAKNKVKGYLWNTNETTETIKAPDFADQFKEVYCTVTDSYDAQTTDSIILTNFLELFPNGIVSYQWDNRPKGNVLTVDLQTIEDYRIYTCTIVDKYEQTLSYPYVVLKPLSMNYNNAVTYKWNTGETTRSIRVNVDEIQDTETFWCTITDAYQRNTTDSIQVDNFATYTNEILSYKWNTGDTTQSIVVNLEDIENLEIFYCTATDKFDKTVTDSIQVDNFNNKFNEISSYKWNTGDTTQSIVVDLNDIDNFDVYYCTAADSFDKKVTESIVVNNFKPIENDVTYRWDTGDTSQSIIVDLSNIEDYDIYYCTATDSFNKKVTETIVVNNFKPIENEITAYRWNTGDTSQSIIVDLDNVLEFEQFYCTATDKFNKTVTDSITVDAFKEITNSIKSYVWFNGLTTESILINTDNIDNEMICWCTATDEYNNKATDSAVVLSTKEITYDEITYKWNTDEVTQSIIVPAFDDEYNVYSCTATVGNKKVTDSIVVDDFKQIEYEIVGYEWNTGEYEQNININLLNFKLPTIISCKATDSLGRSTEGFVTLANGEPEFTYEWSTGSTDQEISLRKNGIYELIVTCESGQTKRTSIELEGLGDRPTVAIDTIPGDIEEGESIVIEALATDLDGTIEKYRWYKVADDGTTRVFMEEYGEDQQSITLRNVKKSDIYYLQVEDDDGYIAETEINIDFKDYTDVMFYRYMNKTYIIPLHAVETDNSVHVHKNSRDLFARYVDENDELASHIHIKINNTVKRLKKL